jgi:hypothetical protein
MPLLDKVPTDIPPKLSDSLLNAAFLFNGTISRGSHRIKETKTPLVRWLEPGVSMGAVTSFAVTTG